ncbi:MAG: 3-isopropylmalate dehydratase small subunit [Candidatus Marinimicrobia bacterium]|nr:3-isopropylmalate dehydratase small subunit [Candidatus Neomarinimicrobiota bacterium]
MKGFAHSYPRAHINTDEIIPARYLNIDQENDLAEHAMEDIDPDFVKNIRKGDIIVAGEDFGCGSSREHAVWALRGAGVRAVIADTFARIFYRNCINNGFLAVECRNVSEKIQTGDELEIDVKGGEIRNLTQNEEYTFLPIPEFAQEIIDAGGLLNYIARKVN